MKHIILEYLKAEFYVSFNIYKINEEIKNTYFSESHYYEFFNEHWVTLLNLRWRSNLHVK